MTVEERGKRPVFLLVLCILSFVYLGFTTLSGVSGLMLGPASEEEMQDTAVQLNESIDELEQNNMESWVPTFKKIKMMTLSANKQYYPIKLVSLLVAALGIFAVMKVFQGDKLGFHLYIMYSISSVCQVYLFHSPSAVPTFMIVLEVILSGVFIAMYAVNLKWMR